jgi:uncharacterized protein YndB with AHSA1/START domain
MMLALSPGRGLAMTAAANELVTNNSKPELEAEGESLCTMELEPIGTAVKLSITHTIDREPSKFIAAVSGGWPKIISNLKSLLETGSAVLQDAYPTGNQRRDET